MGRLIKKLNPKEDAGMKWHTQVGNITTNMRVKIDFTLPGFIVTKIVTCYCHVDEFSKVRYNINLGRYQLEELGLNLKWSENIIVADDGLLKVSSEAMVDLGTCKFKDLNEVKITSE